MPALSTRATASASWVPGDAGEGQGSHPGRATGLVEQDRADVAELQGGRIQVAERAESFLLSGELGLGQQIGDDQVQQVQGVVQRRRLEGPGEGQQGGDPPVRWHPRDHRRPGRGGMAGQGLEPTRGHPRQVEFRDAQGTDLFEPLQGGDQGRAAHPGRGTAKPVQVALPGPLGHDQQRLQPLTLLGVGGGGEDTPEAGRRPITRLGDRACQDGHARQQDLALDQPGGGQVEQQAGPLGADPGAGVEPTDQSGMPGLVGEIAVTIGRLDLVDVVPVGLADAVA